jgi:ribosome modulation factor
MAVSNDVICEASRVYRGDKRTMDSHNGRLRAHLKHYGEQGVDLKALQRISKAFGKIEPDEFVRMLARELHYARLILRAEAQPDMFFNEDQDVRVSNVTRYSDDMMSAESKGYEAGRQGVARDECPYEDGTDLAKAWRKWWRNGSEQRAEAKPASKAANASKNTLRRRQMRVPGTEDIQHSPRRKRRQQRAEAPPAGTGKRLGRPKGSKNKPKVNGPEVVDFPTQLPPAA